MECRETKIIQWLREKITLRLLNESTPKVISNMTKIFVNGFWAGCVYNPIECVNKIKDYRRNALLPIYLSVNFDIPLNTIFIFATMGVYVVQYFTEIMINYLLRTKNTRKNEKR